MAPKKKATEGPTERQQLADLERKLAYGEQLSYVEKRSYAGLIKKHEAEQLAKLVQEIPRSQWCLWSGRDARCVIDQSARYGMPMSEASFSLPAFAKWFHDWLAENGRKIKAFEDSEDAPEGGEWLEAYRKVKTERERLRLQEELKQLIPRDVVRNGMMEVAGMLRKFGELLQRQYGFEASRAFNEQLSDCEQRIDSMLMAMAGDNNPDDGNGD
jgi:hypothetical protein